MDLYVSAVKGRAVGRLESGTASAKNVQIGARFDVELQELVWDLDEVVAIPEAEYAAHRRYYDKAIAGGSLKKRSKKDFEKWQDAASDRGDAERKAAEEARAIELAEGQKAIEQERAKEAEFQKNRRAMLEAAKKKIDAAKAGKSKE